MDPVHFHGRGVWGTAQNLVQAHIHLYPLPQINTDHVSWKGGQYLGLQGICREFHQAKKRGTADVWFWHVDFVARIQQI